MPIYKAKRGHYVATQDADLTWYVTFEDLSGMRWGRQSRRGLTQAEAVEIAKRNNKDY